MTSQPHVSIIDNLFHFIELIKSDEDSRILSTDNLRTTEITAMFEAFQGKHYIPIIEFSADTSQDDKRNHIISTVNQFYGKEKETTGTTGIKS